MESIHTETRNREIYIHKSNLWKFFKTLRVQANPIYCLLVASPLHYAWITIVEKSDSTVQKRVTISQFVQNLKKMPSTNKYYRLGIRLHCPVQEQHNCKSVYEALCLGDLSVEMVVRHYAAILWYHCEESAKKGERFELTPQIFKEYKFKARYIGELEKLLEQYNSLQMNESDK